MQILQNARFRLASCIVWCLCWPAIAVLLLTPLPFDLIRRSDLLGHLLLFGAMTFAVVAFARTRKQIIALSLLAVGYGIGLEFGQAYVPGRFFDVADAIANALGGAGGCLLALAVLKRLRRRAGAPAGAASAAGRSPGALSERP